MQRPILLFVFLLFGSTIADAAATKKPPHKLPVDDKPDIVVKPDKSSSSSSESSEGSSELEGEWECGSEDFSKLISYQSIQQDCPQLLNVVNQCCIDHDGCYDKQENGQAKCDDSFCQCLDRVTYSATNETSVCFEEHSKTFCDAVRTFGEGFYAASAVNTTVMLDGSGSSEEQKTVELLQINHNTTDDVQPKRVRIYESKNHVVTRAIDGLVELDRFN
ncbi:Phospholipase A2-like protein Y52B11A.8 [Aphelenchoides besseyi]|nr:Phospholipase A2-like protein Y52B11A.8 [Aphelenchoides besseyi]